MAIDRQILLLEDDMVQTMMFRAAVDGVHGTVSNFTDAAHAITIMERLRIDLCVVDLGIFSRPGVYHHEAGNRFIATVRNKISQTVPIIVATSGRSPGSLLTSFQAGADDYVLKDEGLEKIVERVRIWLKALPLDRTELRTKRAKVIEFLDKARQAGLDLPS
jgi:DNA-binding response OmpR family regulator